MFAAHIVIGAAHHGALEGALGTLAAHLGGDHLVVDIATLGVAHRVLYRFLAPRICKQAIPSFTKGIYRGCGSRSALIFPPGSRFRRKKKNSLSKKDYIKYIGYTSKNNIEI